MKKIIMEKNSMGFFKIFGQKFVQNSITGDEKTPESEFCKLKEGDRIEIRKLPKE